jgi:CCR4-NOT transcription complex subunit 1
LCDNVPASCIQLRNIIIAASPTFPRKVPDAFTSSEDKLIRVPEFMQVPPFTNHASSQLESSNLLTDVDNYLKSQFPPRFAEDLKSKLLLSPQAISTGGSQYNTVMINALVFNVVTKGSDASKSSSSSELEKAAPYLLIKNLCQVLDREGAFLVLNALANNLRYPNLHTFWTSRIFLDLFMDASVENVKEIIARVLLERVVAHQPQPWGAIFTLVELVRNSKYSFFHQGFSKCAPEIEGILSRIYNRSVVV